MQQNFTIWANQGRSCNFLIRIYKYPAEQQTKALMFVGAEQQKQLSDERVTQRADFGKRTVRDLHSHMLRRKDLLRRDNKEAQLNDPRFEKRVSYENPPPAEIIFAPQLSEKDARPSVKQVERKRKRNRHNLIERTGDRNLDEWDRYLREKGVAPDSGSNAEEEKVMKALEEAHSKKSCVPCLEAMKDLIFTCRLAEIDPFNDNTKQVKRIGELISVAQDIDPIEAEKMRDMAIAAGIDVAPTNPEVMPDARASGLSVNMELAALNDLPLPMSMSN